jgi:hypothetical protein
MRKTLAHSIMIALLAGCGGNVVHPAKPAADVAFYVGDDIYAVGAPIPAMVTWNAWCENTIRIDSGADSHPCKPVPHEVSVHCENEACRLEDTGDTGYRIIPTKPGLMKATLTVTATKTGKRKDYPLEPVQVVLPTTANVECKIALPSYDNKVFAEVVVELKSGDAWVKTGETELRVNGRSTCELGGSPYNFYCPITRPSDVAFELVAPGFKLNLSGRCEMK